MTKKKPAASLLEEGSNLVTHARRELAIIGEDEWVTEGVVKIVQAFADMGHSGSSAEAVADLLDRLLRYQPLTPLTDDPDEWMDRKEESGYALWQNMRDSSAFSYDGGRSYWLLAEGSGDDETTPIHFSEKHK